MDAHRRLLWTTGDPLPNRLVAPAVVVLGVGALPRRSLALSGTGQQV